MTLSQGSIDAFLSYMSANGHPENTTEAYRKDLGNLLRFAGNDIVAPELDRIASLWLTDGRTRWAPRTVRRRHSSVRRWAKWARLPAPLEDYKLPNPGPAQPHPLPGGMDDIDRMIAACGTNQQKRALVVLCGKVGLRIHEARAVEPDDLDDLERTLAVHGKGAKERVVPLTDAVWDALQPARRGARLRDDGKLVPWKDRFARTVFTDLGRKAGVARPVKSHDGRATLGSHVYDETLDIRVLQEILGHASVQTTQVYTRVSMSRMRAAMGSVA